MDNATIDKYDKLLKRSLVAINDLKKQLQEKEDSNEPIAIIGMGCHFPGDCNTPEQFWEFIKEGKDGIVDIPSDRWNIDDYYSPVHGQPGKMYIRQGNFLKSDLKAFDAKYFKISPLEANSLDPQQRHLLEVCVETLENANQNIASLRGSKTGVFIGISSNCEFQKMGLASSMFNQYMATGSNSCIASGRIAFEFGFNGPAISIDTACSSSLVSTLLAVNSLRNRECDLALSGGVNMMVSPDVISSLCAMNALSEDGRCKPFDANGDGYGRGEGCGMVALKRLSDAEKDGDIIYAVIKGGALNNDGESSGLTVPNGTAQKAVLRDSLLASKVNPDEITYFEAHGTGTALGDPIEMGAIKEIYFKDSTRKDDTPLYVGTVKGNIGHLECGAGIAGIIKTALCIYHGKITPLTNLHEMNPRLGIDGLPIVFPDKVIDWDNENGKRPRTAAISAFGFSGTNANLILTENNEQDTAERKTSDSYLLKFSAREESVLVSMMKNLREYFANEKNTNIQDICFSYDSFRKDELNRAVVIGKDKEEIEGKINSLIEVYAKNGTLYDDSVKLLGSSEGLDRMNAKRTMMNKLGEGIYCAKIDEMIKPKVAFIFGNTCDGLMQSADIIRERYPVFKKSYDACMEIMESSGLREQKFAAVEEKIGIFSLEYAFAKLLEELNIVPEIVYGTGVGKYVAAVISEHLTLKGAIWYLKGYLINKYGKENANLISEYNNEVRTGDFGKPKYRYISGKGDSTLRKPEDIVAELQNYDAEDNFENAIQYIFNQGYRTFGMFGELEDKKLLDKEPLNANTVVFSNLEGEKELVDFIGKVYCIGGNIDFEAYYEGAGFKKTVLPTYPFHYKTHWLEPAEKEEGLALYDSRNGLNGVEINLPIASKQFMHIFTYENFPELADNSGVVHIGYYVELLEKYLNRVHEGKKHIIKDMKLSSPIMVFEQEKKDVLLMLDEEDDYETFKFYSKNHEDKKWSLNVSGKVLLEEGKQIVSADEKAMKEKLKHNFTDREKFYDTLVNERGFYFGQAVRFVSEVFENDDKTEAVISFRKCNEQEARKKYFLGYHPGIIDSCAQSANYVGYKGTEQGKRFMVSDIGEIWANGCEQGEEVYCFMTVLEPEGKASEILTSFDLFNPSGDLVVHIGKMRLKEFDEEKIAMLKNGRISSSSNGGKDEYFLNTFLQAGSDERINLLSEYIRKLLAEAIGMEFEEVDIHENLDDLGLDSMSGLMFVSNMDEKFGIDLTFSDLANCKNVYDTAVMVRSLISGETVTDNLIVKLKDYKEDLSIDRWICNYKENKNSKFRIFCFPNGYNSADMFEGWKEILGDSFEICGIQLPGMDSKRMNETTPEDIEEFVGVLEQVIVDNNMLDKPCAIFGHSWGALFAYRFAYRLSLNKNANIVRLFVSAFTSPIQKNTSLVKILEELESRGISSLPTYAETQQDAVLYDAVVQAFTKAWGYEEGMTKLSLQFLLSALKLIDGYTFDSQEKFEIPIVGFHGVDDYLVAIEEMEQWEQVTKGSFKLCSMAGDHQYVNKNQSESELLVNIKEELLQCGCEK